MLEVNKIYNGDCLEKMKDIPDKSIDMILCDLPYGTTSCKWDVVIPFNKYVQIGKKAIYEQEYVFDKMKSGVSYKEALEDFLSISKDGLWDNYKRIIKDRGAIVLFGSEPFSSYLRMSNIKMYKYDWIWEKDKGTSFALANKQPLRKTENIIIFYKKQPFYNSQGEKLDKPYKHTLPISKSDSSGGAGEHNLNSNGTRKYAYYTHSKKHNLLYFARESQVSSLHTTQKPVALLEFLIKTYTLEGETVLDNCAGSGSTVIACLNTNRNFIGIEKDDTYFEIAKKRIADAIKDSETKLF